VEVAPVFPARAAGIVDRFPGRPRKGSVYSSFLATLRAPVVTFRFMIDSCWPPIWTQ